MAVLRALCLFTLIVASMAFRIEDPKANQRDVSEETKEYLENVKNKAYQSIEKLENSASKVQVEISDELNAKLTEAFDELDKTIENVLTSKLSHLQLFNGNVAVCVEKYEPQMRQAVEDGKAKTKKSVENSVSNIGDILEPVKSYIENIELELKTLDGSYKKCWNPNSPIESETCILQDCVKVQQLVKKHLNDGEFYITGQGAQVSENLRAAKEGIEKILKETHGDVEALVKNVVSCIILGEGWNN